MNATLFTESAAGLSDCQRYRYWLTRTWARHVDPVCFVMLNPSVADAVEDDPTIRRCIGFARAWGAGGIVVVNLFAYRATDPNDLWRAGAPVGPENNAALIAWTAARRVIAAWGCNGDTNGRDAAVVRLLTERGVSLECLGVTKAGHPRHPLYVRADALPVPFKPAPAPPAGGGTEE